MCLLCTVSNRKDIEAEVDDSRHQRRVGMEGRRDQMRRAERIDKERERKELEWKCILLLVKGKREERAFLFIQNKLLMGLH